MINKKNMMDCVCQQLVIDYNCSPDDFYKDGLIFTEARENEGRCHFPFVTTRLEMISCAFIKEKSCHIRCFP